MFVLSHLTSPQLIDLLGQAYDARAAEPGERLTDPIVRYGLIQLLDSDDDFRAAVMDMIGAWLGDP